MHHDCLAIPLWLELTALQSEHHPEQASSLELDEQLARQLQLEDQEQAQQQQQRQRARGQTWQPRQRGDSDQNQPAAEGGNQDNFQEIKETFNQIAESKSPFLNDHR